MQRQEERLLTGEARVGRAPRMGGSVVVKRLRGAFVYGFMSVGVVLSTLLVFAVVADARTVFVDPTSGGTRLSTPTS